MIVIVISACNFSDNNDGNNSNAGQDNLSRLERIIKRDTLIAITDYNSTSYFIYRGTPMGFQYERAKELANHLGVKLKVITENNIDTAIHKLNQGKGDLIAMDLTINFSRREQVDFINPHYQTRQMLIQRKPEGWRNMSTYDEVEKHLIRSPIQLLGKTVHVQKNSAYVSRLKNLMEEMGDSIHIVQARQATEQLIKMVANGEINYTVADEHIAKVNQRYYQDIDTRTALSFPQNVAWAVKQGNDTLERAINDWQKSFKGSYYANVLHNKYFKNPRSKRIFHSAYYSLNNLRLSQYDEIIKKEAKELGWDWRLLASMIYQESQFSENAHSWAGAYGIMQMMPQTMRRFNIDSSSSIKEQINAGIKYIKWLDKQFKNKIKDPEERKKFILASYNVGLAHVKDAMRLAKKYGKDPSKWNDNVAYYLRRKSKPEFYRDSVVHYGYARGEEPFQYVNKIYERYQHYQNILD
ncbi:MAG: transporter substrate-binding domain-containing protein [Bacteroidales bacterium]|nr:transporter substrate-binding domain-containing protein [Bacteroidales bacterium]MCF8333486.1 transporter substrate-binding domain-containing protein [Bacteroidales bacterium]